MKDDKTNKNDDDNKDVNGGFENFQDFTLEEELEQHDEEKDCSEDSEEPDHDDDLELPQHDEAGEIKDSEEQPSDDLVLDDEQLSDDPGQSDKVNEEEETPSEPDEAGDYEPEELTGEDALDLEPVEDIEFPEDDNESAGNEDDDDVIDRAGQEFSSEEEQVDDHGSVDDADTQKDSIDKESVPDVYKGGQVDERRTDLREQESTIRKRKEDIQARADGLKGEDGDEGRKGRMGERLVAMGIITEDQLSVALQEKKISGKMLGEVLVDLGFLDEETLSAVLSESSGFDVFDPATTIVDGEALALIDKKTAQKYHVLPVSMRDNSIKVAMVDPYDVLALDTLRQFIPKGMQISPIVTTASVLSEAIDAAFGYASSINDILQELESFKDDKKKFDIAGLDENEAFTHPIVRLVNALIFDAVKIGASDLHFEPEENFVRLRYRVDGVLYTAQILHKQFWNGISQRIKIMSNMNIADKLTSQDGRCDLSVAGREVDFRVSTLPTVFGENIVMRVLDKSVSIMDLADLGFSEENLAKIKRAQSRPEGIIIVTGPTGSGKTTSLYSMLNEINNVEVNIKTLEDPVEYSLPMIRQTQVREGVLEFADGIRSILRQDPDIIFIGEIRDGITAEMALKASMTGHQVYTTLHTNDSFGALPRLFDLGLVPGMVAGNIIAVFAQRLTRRLCEYCKQEHSPTEDECDLLKVSKRNPPRVYKAKQGGCDMCGGQGYKGRVAIAEILNMDEDLDDLMVKGATKAELKTEARKKGFKSLKDDAVLKVIEGITSIEAISRVVDLNE